MPLSEASQLTITPTETGSMVDVPPDIPDGHFRAAIECRDGNDDEGYYRIFIGFKVTENFDGTQDGLGTEAAIIVTFYPEDHRLSKMNKQEVKRICDSLNLDEPDTSSLSDGDNESLKDWVARLEETQAEIWTRSKLDKNDVMRTRIFFKEPGKKLVAAPRTNGAANHKVEAEKEAEAPVEEEKPATKGKKGKK